VSNTVTTPSKSKTDLSDSVSEYNVNLDTQEVIVKGTLPYDDVLGTIKKTGKEVSMDTISRETFSYVRVRFALE